jgi:hypothetical protein
MHKIASNAILINIVKSSQELIFCPMCYLEHDNNTWCQFTGGEFYEIN